MTRSPPVQVRGAAVTTADEAATRETTVAVAVEKRIIIPGCYLGVIRSGCRCSEEKILRCRDVNFEGDVEKKASVRGEMVYEKDSDAIVRDG